MAVSSLAVALFVRDSYLALGLYAAASLVAYLLSGVPAVWFWRAFRPLLWLVGLTFLVQVLFLLLPLVRGHGTGVVQVTQQLRRTDQVPRLVQVLQ